MVDDSELRARIAARVAARRAERLAPLRTGGPPPPEPTPEPTPEPMPEPTPEPMPQPTPDPVPQPTPEPIPQPTPEPIPQPTPDPLPPPASRVSARKRPRPGPRTETEPSGSKTEPTATPAAEDGRKPAGTSARRSAAVLRRMVRIAVLLAIAAVAVLVLRVFVVAPYYIPSGSMEPTLHGCAHCDDDHILIDKVSYRFHAPQEGDIVVFHRPAQVSTPDSALVKRVIGLPGDHLALRHGLVYIDGKRLKEPYLDKKCGPRASTPETGRSHWTIPRGDVFVMGDNRCDSFDSRDFGPIPESSIIGRAFAIVWPLGRIGLL